MTRKVKLGWGEKPSFMRPEFAPDGAPYQYVKLGIDFLGERVSRKSADGLTVSKMKYEGKIFTFAVVSNVKDFKRAVFLCPQNLYFFQVMADFSDKLGGPSSPLVPKREWERIY